MICPLCDQKAFIAIHRSRHRCQSDLFSAAFQFVAADDRHLQLGGVDMTGVVGAKALFLGFVLPKKLIKRAVDRNQVKRWVRAGLKRVRCVENSQMVIRPRSRLELRSVSERTRVREDLMMLIAAATQKLQHGG